MKKDFFWENCNFDLNVVSNGTTFIQNLSKKVMFTNPCESAKVLSSELEIQLQKELLYNNELGWNWHKSCNIPTLDISLKIFDEVSNEEFIPPTEIKCELYVVKAEGNQKRFFFESVGVCGNSIQILNNNKCKFSSLKFSSTSHKCDGSKFHLIVVTSANINNSENLQIICAKVSPPIFIDSRKFATTNCLLSEKQPNTKFNLFSPTLIEKKQFGRNKNHQNMEINNNYDDLITYFKASNIKHKIYHPVFIALKFYSCTSLYYNSQEFQSRQVQYREILQELQRRLQHLKENQANKPFIILKIKCFGNKEYCKEFKKIQEKFRIVSLNLIQLVSDNDHMPTLYNPLNDHDKLYKAYQSLSSSIQLSPQNIQKPSAKQQNQHIITEIDLSKKTILNQIPQNYELVSLKQKLTKKKYQNQFHAIAAVTKINFEPQIIKKQRVEEVIEESTAFSKHITQENQQTTTFEEKKKNIEQLLEFFGALVMQTDSCEDKDEDNLFLPKLNSEDKSIEKPQNFHENNQDWYPSYENCNNNNHNNLSYGYQNQGQCFIPNYHQQEFDNIDKYLQLECNDFKNTTFFKDEELFNNYSLEINYNKHAT